MATPVPCIAVFDIGKTNKKFFLFNEAYQIVFQRSIRLKETTDEDGDPCEDLVNLSTFLFDSLNEVFAMQESFTVKAVNVSSYGASMVYLDAGFNVIAPLYSYLKPYPEELASRFELRYGDTEFALQTGSPLAGSLNSGLQLYRMKHLRPKVFAKVNLALHLPQYLVFLLSGKLQSDITSIGCHTALWDFRRSGYHTWLLNEDLTRVLVPIVPSDHTTGASLSGHEIICGPGIHDSSAALIPYLNLDNKPFILISSGTWCISLNPFNSSPLTPADIDSDVLFYLQANGKPVKAARLFAGDSYEKDLKKLTHKDSDYGEAYLNLIKSIARKQVASTNLIMQAQTTKIYVDGGFSTNQLYMKVLAASWPALKVYAAVIPQSTAIGAAMVIHKHWNAAPLPKNHVLLKQYEAE